MENCFDWFTGSSEWQLRLVVEHRVLPSPDAPAYARKKGSREALARRPTGPLRVPIGRLRQVHASIWIETRSIGIIGFMQRIASGAIIRCHKLEIVAKDFQGIPLAYCIPAGIEQPRSPLSGTTDKAI
jgi:hypothetical protein